MPTHPHPKDLANELDFDKPVPPSNGRPRRRDRRPKALHPRCACSVSMSADLKRVVMNEVMRRNLPSASALIEIAIEKEVRHRSEPEEADLLNVMNALRELRQDVRRLDRESADRDVIQSEMVAGLARSLFAAFPPPDDEGERDARVARARLLFDRFLDNVGRRVEAGETVLSQMPDPPANEPAIAPTAAWEAAPDETRGAVEKNLLPADVAEDAS